MAIYTRPDHKNWIIEFTVDGKRFRRSSGTPHRRAAERLEEKWREEVHQGKHRLAKPVPMTLSAAVDRYYATVTALKPSRERTKKAERCALDILVRQLGPQTRLEVIDAATITQWRDDLLASHKAAATVNRYLATLRAILNRARRDWNALAEVPRFALLPLNNTRYRFLNEDEERAILAASAPHLRDLIVFLIDTGARMSEALELTWGDVDLDGLSTGVRFMRTKSGVPRRVPLTTRVQDTLRRLRKGQGHPSGRVFLFRPNGRSEAVPYKQPHGAWKSALRRAGVDPDLRIHDLRHTFASRLVSRGVPLFDVSKLLGHQTMAMTMRYAHLAPDAYEAAIAKLEPCPSKDGVPLRVVGRAGRCGG